MNTISSYVAGYRTLPVVGFFLAALGISAVVVFTSYGPQAIIALTFSLVLVYLAFRKPLMVVYFLLLTGSLSWGFITGDEKVFFKDHGGLDLNGIRLVGVILAFSLILLYKKEGRQRFFTSLPYLFFLAFAAAGLLRTWNFSSGIRLFSKFLYPYIIFCVVLMEATDRQTIDKLIRMMFWGGVVALVSIPISTFFGLSTEISPEMIKLGGGATHRSPFALYMMCITTLSIALYFPLQEKKYLLLSVLGSVVVLLTLTRIAIAGLVVSAAVVLFRRSFWIGLVLTAMTLIFLLSYEPLQKRMFYQGSTTTYMDLIKEPNRFFTDVSAMGRFPAWGAGIYHMFLRSPMVGMGTGSSTGIEYEAGNRLTVMHSEVVRILAEQGLIGTCLYVFAFVMLLRLLRRSRGKHSSPITEACMLSMFALVPAYFVVCLTDNAFDYYTMLGQNIFTIAALALRSAELDRNSDTSWRDEK